ncbi:MAG TPA: hypothetical protein VGP19_08570 [Candidatus Acidoferrales bacterium]|jgi:hypothetical protein|nr:hypothetical protein [Candidatus Acidoferrales bacterium]
MDGDIGVGRIDRELRGVVKASVGEDCWTRMRKGNHVWRITVEQDFKPAASNW